MGWEDFKREREKRLKTPEFQAAIDQEKQEFFEHLTCAKDAGLDFLYKGMIKKVLLGTVSAEARSLFNDKHKLADPLNTKQKKGSEAGLIGTTKRTAGAGLMGLKAVGKIAQAAGKGIKIGARYLVAK